MKPLINTWRQGCILCFLLISHLLPQAQITASGNDVFILNASDTLYVNGLGFYPDSTFNLTGISILESTTLQNSSSNPHINKVFSFAPNNPSFSGVLGFRYKDSDLNGIPEADLQLNFFNTTWTRATSDSLNTGSNYLISSPLNSLPKELTLASRLNALPLLWLDMLAQKQDNNNIVSWKTAQEDQVLSFSILHSVDGKHWAVLGTMQPKGHLYNQYTFIHRQPAASKHFYRIRELDTEGNISLSTIAFLNTDDRSTDFQVYPNPSSQGSSMHLKMTTESTIRIYQSNGILIYAKKLSAGDHLFNATSLKSGTYWVTDGQHTVPWILQ